MDARRIRAAMIAACLLFLGAGYRTQNFVVTAPTPHFAQQVAVSAENFRRDLALEWLGQELPPWREPCPIRVDVGAHLGAGGATSFAFVGGQPTGWTMSIQGSAERILDSVLPHEVTHTIFATHFGRPLPRWADEGACTIVEHESEKQKQHRLLYEFLSTNRGIAFNQMFAMQEYPPDMLPLYSQGYSLARFLVAQGGKQKFVDYVGDGMRWNNWTKATQKHYSFNSLSDLQVTWLEWVRRGCPAITPTSDAPQLADSNEAGMNGEEVAEDAGSIEVPARLISMTNSGQPKADGSSIGSMPKAKGTGTGWYARVRDATAEQNRGNGAPMSQNAPKALHEAVSQALSRGSMPRDPQVVTRPQPVQQAQQQVLEWVSGQ